MNYQRVTVSLPNYVYDDLLALIGKGKISNFVAEATQKRLLQQKIAPKKAIASFWALRDITPRRTIKQILDGIHKGRA